jgi:putative membrane protein
MKPVFARALLYAKGVAMGAADVIPGVSGGTIAFITGIYREFIGALHKLDHHALRMLFTGKWGTLWRYINAPFLLTLMLGIFTAVLSLATLITYLLEAYPVFLWAFFFGLIVASIVVVFGKFERFRLSLLLFILVGALVAYFVSTSSVIRTPDTPPFVFMAGVISIMAMILPGVSGSFLLVVLDKYNYVIGAVSSVSEALRSTASGLFAGDWSGIAVAWADTQWFVLLMFYLGALTGLIGFSKVLNWLFQRFYDPTIALLIGFLVGSLSKVWPWKTTVETYTDRHGEVKPLVEENVLPPQLDDHTLAAVGLALVGFVLVYGLERLSHRYQTASKEPATTSSSLV